MPKLADYEPIIGSQIIEELYLLAERLKGKTIQNINSTAVGGGVAEILTRMIPLLNELGVDARWDLIKGGETFFNITKRVHNALHGAEVDLSPSEIETFLQTNRENAGMINWSGDIVFIHDPQPIALVEKRKEIGRNWVWRCHIDFSSPHPPAWEFLRGFIEQYDSAVFSAPAFARQLPIRQVLISPSIDPLSEKNRELSQKEILSVFEKLKIDPEMPTLTQISRFDYLKDPFGVINAYKQVKRYIDCQLILAGGGAVDDPEGNLVYQQVLEKAGDDPNIHVLLLPPSSDLEINALQRGSTVILQKSLREGFGLTIAEALWKKKPVVASAVGGIPLQITHKYSGILTYTVEGTAFWLRQLLQSPEFAQKLGDNGYHHIQQNFLITRHIKDYLLLFISLYHPGEEVVYL